MTEGGWIQSCKRGEGGKGGGGEGVKEKAVWFKGQNTIAPAVRTDADAMTDDGIVVTHTRPGAAAG
jgi:hypothetical protein